MKIYNFYRYDKSMTKRDYEELKSEGLTNADIRSLYAVTTNKKYAKIFREQRDMNQFIEIVKDDVDKEDALAFMQLHRGAVLKEHDYSHFVRRKLYKKLNRSVKILSTEQEFNLVDIVTADGIFCEDLIKSEKMMNPYILKEEYRKCLDVLGYITVYAMTRVDSGDFVPLDFEEPSLDVPGYMVDEFKVFINRFSEFFK